MRILNSKSSSSRRKLLDTAVVTVAGAVVHRATGAIDQSLSRLA
ncbi:hypothetical protein HDG38_006892 [Paraburkholderia sp. WSM4177]|nr:hypothetical protein [Paraburkholderia sp. WSM4177]